MYEWHHTKHGKANISEGKYHKVQRVIGDTKKHLQETTNALEGKFSK